MARVQLIQSSENQVRIAFYWRNEILLITSLSKGSGELTSLTLIHNENFPARCFLENRYEILLASDSLIRCHENMILRPRRSSPRELMEKLILLHNFPGLLFSMERNDT